MSAPVVELEQTEHRNYTHLVYDIAWFGLALAATSRFLSVYAIRLGATPVDLGWIASLPALVLMISASFGSRWLRRFKNTHDAMLLPGFGFRLLFLLPVFAPFMPPDIQPLWLIASVTLPAIPQGIAGVVFIIAMRNSIFDNHIPALLGRRALALNAAIGVGALGFGLLLEQVVFPTNYQLMFLTAFAFALVSMWHVNRLHILTEPQHTPAASSGEAASEPQSTSAWRNRKFRRVAFVTAVIHLAFFAIVPITPLYLVDRLGADEGFMALFGMLELLSGAIVSLVAPRLIRRIGAEKLIALAMGGTALAALAIAAAPSLPFTLIAAFLSGGSWTAAASVGLWSLYMERTPSEQPAKYSTAFHQAVGISVFIGPMVGSLLASHGVNLLLIILLGAVLRIIAAALIAYNQRRTTDYRSTSEQRAVQAI
ncbi:MAG: MFS transporter [Anaerolineae bacterium]|nr:MFS transporter [Anaerolineae bacterium]